MGPDTLRLTQAARRYEKLRQAAANSPRRRALLEERARFVAESLRRWYGPPASEPEAWALFARYFASPFAMTLEERDRAEALGTRLLLATPEGASDHAGHCSGPVRRGPVRILRTLRPRPARGAARHRP